MKKNLVNKKLNCWGGNKNLRTSKNSTKIIVISIVALFLLLLLPGIISGYNRGQNRHKVNRALDNIAIGVESIRTAFADMPDYSLLNKTPDLNLLPSDNEQGFHSFGGKASYRADKNNNRQFFIRYEKLPSSACYELTKVDFGSNDNGFLGININGQMHYNNELFFNNALAERDCNACSDNCTVDWYFL